MDKETVKEYWHTYLKDVDTDNALPHMLRLREKLLDTVAKPQAHWCWGCLVHCTALTRAHIIARSRGGLNERCNLVLLCRSCHDESPDEERLDPMLHWIAYKLTKDQESKRLLEHFYSEMKVTEKEKVILEKVKAAKNFVVAGKFAFIENKILSMRVALTNMRHYKPVKVNDSPYISYLLHNHWLTYVDWKREDDKIVDAQRVYNKLNTELKGLEYRFKRRSEKSANLEQALHNIEQKFGHDPSRALLTGEKYESMPNAKKMDLISRAVSEKKTLESGIKKIAGELDVLTGSIQAMAECVRYESMNPKLIEDSANRLFEIKHALWLDICRERIFDNLHKTI